MRYQFNLHHYPLFVAVAAVWLKFAHDLHGWLSRGVVPPPF